MFNATVTNLLNKRVKLDSQVIKCQGLSKEDVDEYNKQRKALVVQDKLNAYKANNCTIEYKNTTLAFNPRGVEGKQSIIWKDADKNAILIASPDKDNKVKLYLIPCVAKTNKLYEWRQALIKKTQAGVIQAFANVVEGLDWDAFVKKCTAYKSYKTVKATGALKEVK